MYLKATFNLLKYLFKALKFILYFIFEWLSIHLVILSIGGVIVYYHYSSIVDYSLTDTMKDKIELASWVFAGNIGLISFLSLFVAFVYDNKHIEASRVLRQYYKPYGLSFETIKTSLNDYSTYVNRGIMLSVIHGLLTLTSIASIIIWGVAVSAYTENRINLT